MTRVFRDVDELRAHAGEQLGVGPWIEVDQAAIDKFADATRDNNWIHVDPARAASSPFGSTIAHGYLSLALIGGQIQEIVQVDNIRLALNYGVQRARFPNAIRVGASVRLNLSLTDVTSSRTDDGMDAHFHSLVEIAGEQRPGCVADTLVRYYPG